jgi:hypothetical protein
MINGLLPDCRSSQLATCKRERLLTWLCVVCLCVGRWFNAPSDLHRNLRRHPLTLDGLAAFAHLRELRRTYLLCCTLYLVFKEPETQPHPVRFRGPDAVEVPTLSAVSVRFRGTF